MKTRKLLQLAMAIIISVSVAGCIGAPATLEIVHLGKPVRPGDIETLTVLGVDRRGGMKPVIADWSLEGDNGLLFNSSGHVAYIGALSPGTAKVTARKGNLVDISDFEVYQPVLTKLTCMEMQDYNPFYMWVGEKKSFYANGYDQVGRELAIDPVWSVTDELGIFSECEDTGWLSIISFEATKGGIGTLTVEQGGLSLSYRLVVEPYERVITRYEIDPVSVIVYVGDRMDFCAFAWDQIGGEIWLDSSYALEGDVGWVQDYGRGCILWAEKAGTGKIVASYGTWTSTAEVVVIERPIE